jgi:hypothetical protein
MFFPARRFSASLCLLPLFFVGCSRSTISDYGSMSPRQIEAEVMRLTGLTQVSLKEAAKGKFTGTAAPLRNGNGKRLDVTVWAKGSSLAWRFEDQGGGSVSDGGVGKPIEPKW